MSLRPKAQPAARPAAPRRKTTRNGRKGRTGRTGRGALFVIALLLGLSGIIRLGSGASHALAKGNAAAPAEPAICAAEPGAIALLDSLRERELRLAEREAGIADRVQAMALAKIEIDDRLAALTSAEESLSATLAKADQAADQDVARLVAVYERMKPKDAAPLFAEMAPEFAAGFLARMRPEAAAAVMAGLEPKAAYAISILLAGRNANAPRN